MASRRKTIAAIVACAVTAAAGGVAQANTSHDGWPKIDGVLKMNKDDGNDTMTGTRRATSSSAATTPTRSTATAGRTSCGATTSPPARAPPRSIACSAAAGSDFIYASHGQNIIVAGSGNDTIHAHFGRGSIDCGAGRDTLFISHRSKPGYRLSHCERISFKTLGH